MLASGACVVCGKAVDPAAAFIREDGLRCPPCNLRQDIVDGEASQARRDVEAIDQSLSRRARRLARGHVVVWSSVVLILADKTSPWIAAGLPVVAALYVGLALRHPWAYRLAQALDGAALLAALAWTFTATIPPGGWLLPAFLIAFPIVLLVLLRLIRHVYVTAGPAVLPGQVAQ